LEHFTVLSTRRVRLATGLILFGYVTLHILNLALGLVGLELMTAVGTLWGRIWGTPPGLLLLYGSLLVHLGLALQSLYLRRRLRMPPAEMVQLALGLSIPPLLAIHAISVRGGAALFGIDSNYRVLQTIFWNGDAAAGLQQVVGLIAAWLHGCLGLFFWLRVKPFFERWKAQLLAAAVAVPVLGLAGFLASGREVRLRAEADPNWARTALEPLNIASEAERARLGDLTDWFLIAFVLAIVIVLLARYLRLYRERSAGQFRLDYVGGRSVATPTGMTILEASRLHGIPHASVCGGRGRCSTCRVRIEGTPNAVVPPAPQEARILKQINAPAGVRLACQLRPRGNLKVTLLLPPGTDARDVRSGTGFRQGEERVLIVLFADLQGFTTLAEAKLPYDVVFLLNRLAREWGEAIEEHGGRIDKFMGDGVMALFGLETDAAEGARRSLSAAREMDQRLSSLNQSLAADLPQPLRIGIGIHAGPVIVGEIGFGDAARLTAVGDVVNTASRLEAATRDLGSTLVVSESVLDLAGWTLENAEHHEIAVRGRAALIKVVAANRW